MELTQEQITSILTEVAKEKSGYTLILKLALESIMRAEQSEFNLVHTDSKNGYRLRSILAHGGKLELVVPRSRHHNFYPLILALIKDQNEEIKNIAYELYSAGLTTEQVGSMFDKIYGQTYSKSSISNMMQHAREDIDAWLNRKLDARYPIVYIDATYWHTRRDKQVSQEAFYTILGVKEDRTREVLSIVNHPTEGATNWKDVFIDLKNRGVRTINLFVCDGLQGIENVIAEEFPMATTQLCTVHLTRNILSKVKPAHKQQIADGIKIVLNPTNINDSSEKGFERFKEFIQPWIKTYPSLKNYLQPRYEMYFNYLNYHIEIRRMIYTTNWIERLNRNYKRTLRMRTSMPSPESVLFLMGAVACKRKEFDKPIYQF